MLKNYTIRLEKDKDFFEVENLTRESFWNIYRPGCLEHYVLHCLRTQKDFVKDLDFVLEIDGKIIAQIVFVKANIATDDNKLLPILTMGPLSVSPQFQHKGYGKILLDYSLKQAKTMGFGAVCIEGNYDFYKNCGFDFASNFNLRYHDLPQDADASFFLCCQLIDGYLKGVSGEYSTPQCYFVDEQKAEEFDKNFPPKTKLKLPTQLF